MAFYPGTRIGNPASSCKDIPQDRPSGEYWITIDSTSSPVQVYCDMNQTSCSCNTAGGWMRVANLDMTDPNQNCPEGLRLVTRTEPPLRTYGKHALGCLLPIQLMGWSIQRLINLWSNHCISKQFTRCFCSIFQKQSLSIDDVYVDGVSLTHGQSPCQHIWTFVNAIDETRSDGEACPCTRPDFPYTLELYLPSSVKTTSVKLEGDSSLLMIPFILIIHSGMVRDVGVTVLA